MAILMEANLQPKGVIGTLDSMMYRKNQDQDYLKYIIRKMNKREKCIGVDPFHYSLTGDCVPTITANVGQSTSIGPKVAIRINKKGNGKMEEEINVADSEKGKFLEDDEIAIVRRLTPIECERLMGFPDRHLTPMCSDSNMYRGAGNSWAVNCARFIMSRIHIVNDLIIK